MIKESIDREGYNVPDEPVIFSPHYIGIPQHRERVYIMCVRKDVGTQPEFFFDTATAAPCDINSILQADDEIENLEEFSVVGEIYRPD